MSHKSRKDERKRKKARRPHPKAKKTRKPMFPPGALPNNKTWAL